MNTEITDTMNGSWVCYDAECALCVRWARRFRGLLENHGFTLLPLQSPAVRAVLPVPERELLAEMRVITAKGRVFGGADALAYLSSVICKPIFWLTRIPGAMPLLRRAYRYVARNRGCAGNACHAPRAHAVRVGNPADWLPLLVFVIAAAVVGSRLTPWLYMWLLAFALFAGCKWLVFRKALARGVNASFGRKFGFLFGWIGMDATGFFANQNPAMVAKINFRVASSPVPPHPGPLPRGEGETVSRLLRTVRFPTQSNSLLCATLRRGRPSKIYVGDRSKPGPREIAFAVLKITIGAMLLWVAAPYAFAINPLLAGWTGMIGLVLLLHFGLFHLLSLAWRSAGVNAPPLMRAPILSRSIGEFWGERWNTAFNKLAATFLFRPLHRVVGARAATMIVFLASGMIHDLVISVPARGGYGLPTLYFLIQGAGVLFEHTRLARRLGIHGGFRGWLFTVVVAAGPAFWLFHPSFIRTVILPFLKCLGAT